MARTVKLRDVAVAAGVHPATASRALNEATRSLVSRGTAERVVEVAKLLGYQPNHVARSLKTKRSNTVGVLVPDLTNPLFPPIIRGIEDALATAGFVPLLGNTDGDDERERTVLERFLGRTIDGLIAATARRQHPLLVEVSQNQPVVLVNRVVDDHLLPSVSVDDGLGTRSVVDHLAGLGHRKIAHVAGPQAFSTGYGRYRGYLAGLASWQLDPDPELVAFAEAFSEAEGYRCCSELLCSGRELSAVVAGNDMLALGCLRAIEEQGFSCPGDVSVVGFNDMPFADRLSPPLTTIRFPHYQVGVEAANLMLERLSDRQTPTKALFLAPSLVVRSSTAPPAPRLRGSARGLRLVNRRARQEEPL